MCQGGLIAKAGMVDSALRSGYSNQINLYLDSDAPDDYVALRELKNKPEWRVQYKITAEMVEPYEVVPIIEIPGYGDQAAVTVSERLKIRVSTAKDSGLRQLKCVLSLMLADWNIPPLNRYS